MSHAVTKFLNSIVTASAVLVIVSCGSSAKNDDAAAALLQQAQSAIDAGDCEQALTLLDSIDHAYPKALQIRSQAIDLRPRAIEKIAVAAIEEADSAIARADREVARLTPMMTMHENKEIGESYYTPSQTDNASFVNTTGISVRVNGQTGELYLVSSVNPGRIDQRYVTFADNAGNVVSTDTIAADSPANFINGNSELLEFLPRYCGRIADFVAANDGAPMTATIVGDKGSRTVKIGAKTSEAIANAARLSQALTQGRKAVMERDRLEQNLQVARKQQQKK